VADFYDAYIRRISYLSALITDVWQGFGLQSTAILFLL